MRNNPTEAEKALYTALKNAKIKHYRQYLIEGYIVDAYLPEKKVAIECDGGYHNIAAQQFYDIDRDNALLKKNITTLRFTNEEILQNPMVIVSAIKKRFKIKARTRPIKRKKSKRNTITSYKEMILIKIRCAERTQLFEKMSKMPSSVFVDCSTTLAKKLA